MEKYWDFRNTSIYKYLHLRNDIKRGYINTSPQLKPWGVNTAWAIKSTQALNTAQWVSPNQYQQGASSQQNTGQQQLGAYSSASSLPTPQVALGNITLMAHHGGGAGGAGGAGSVSVKSSVYDIFKDYLSEKYKNRFSDTNTSGTLFRTFFPKRSI